MGPARHRKPDLAVGLPIAREFFPQIGHGHGIGKPSGAVLDSTIAGGRGPGFVAPPPKLVRSGQDPSGMGCSRAGEGRPPATARLWVSPWSSESDAPGRGRRGYVIAQPGAALVAALGFALRPGVYPRQV